MAWLSRKPVEWHQKLYAILNEHLQSLEWRKDGLRKKLQQSKVIRLANGQYSTASKCFFPSDEGKDDDGLPASIKAFTPPARASRSRRAQENFSKRSAFGRLARRSWSRQFSSRGTQAQMSNR